MRFGLQTKFSAFITILVISVTGILGIFFYRLQKQTMYMQLIERGTTIAESAARDAEYGVLTANEEDINRISEQLLGLQDVSFCVVGDNTKEFLVRRFSRDDIKIPDSTLKFKADDTKVVFENIRVDTGDAFYVFTAPIKGVIEEEFDESELFALDEEISMVTSEESEVIGSVRVGLSLSRIEELLKNTLYTIIIITLCIILVAALITVFLIRLATVPILRLVEGTHRLADGDLSVRIKEKSRDEIGELAEAFNAMASALQGSRIELIESKEYANSIVENMLDSLFVVDVKGNIQSYNPAAADLLAYSLEELSDDHIATIFARRKDSLDLMNEVIDKGEVNDFEIDFLTKIGEEIPVSVSASLMFAQNGDGGSSSKEISGVVIAARDMRKMVALIDDINKGKEKLEEWSKTLEQRVDERTRELLRSQETMLNIMTDLEASKSYIENVVANLMDSLVVLNMEGNIRSANAVTRELLGYTEDGIVGKDFTTLIGAPEIIDELKRDGHLRNRETSYLTSDKAEIPIFISGALMKDKVGDSTGIVLIAKDITEQKKAEAELHTYVKQVEEINKELDDFTYIVSHDLKEPLRSIDAFSKFVAEDYSEHLDEDGMMYINRVRSNASRMQKLIEDLLEVSRLERKQNPLQPAQAKGLVEDAAARLEYAIMEKNVKVIIQDEFPTVFCDRHRLGEVFYNLMSNAIKFMEKEQPIIEVGCEEDNGFYKFHVKDNGIGIEEQYFDKIFQIFQRLGKREQYEGTGAGLTIVKKVIGMHGGNIWVESTYGEGTTFFFTIPIVEGLEMPEVVDNHLALDDEEYD